MNKNGHPTRILAMTFLKPTWQKTHTSDLDAYRIQFSITSEVKYQDKRTPIQYMRTNKSIINDYSIKNKLFFSIKPNHVDINVVQTINDKNNAKKGLYL